MNIQFLKVLTFDVLIDYHNFYTHTCKKNEHVLKGLTHKNA